MDPTKTQLVFKQCVDLYNNHGFKPVPLKTKKLTQVENIVEKEKRRLGIKHPRITMEQLGFEEIKSQDNVFNMAKKNKIDITKIQSDSQYRIKIGLKAR